MNQQKKRKKPRYFFTLIKISFWISLIISDTSCSGCLGGIQDYLKTNQSAGVDAGAFDTDTVPGFADDLNSINTGTPIDQLSNGDIQGLQDSFDDAGNNNGAGGITAPAEEDLQGILDDLEKTTGGDLAGENGGNSDNTGNTDNGGTINLDGAHQGANNTIKDIFGGNNNNSGDPNSGDGDANSTDGGTGNDSLLSEQDKDLFNDIDQMPGETDGNGGLGSNGDGSGDGNGSGFGDGSGDGNGSGFGDGSGDGNGSGFGDGSGDGNGSGFGDGSGDGNGSGFGDGSGDGNGSGFGDGSGDGNGGLGSNGDGSGDGNGGLGSNGDSSGDGNGSGFGDGSGDGNGGLGSNGDSSGDGNGDLVLSDNNNGNLPNYGNNNGNSGNGSNSGNGGSSNGGVNFGSGTGSISGGSGGNNGSFSGNGSGRYPTINQDGNNNGNSSNGSNLVISKPNVNNPLLSDGGNGFDSNNANGENSDLFGNDKGDLVTKTSSEFGDGSGNGNGSGFGDGSGNGNGSGFGDGSGNGNGSGFGDGSGNGNGSGFGDGSGNGNGSGFGDGSGNGNGLNDDFNFSENGDSDSSNLLSNNSGSGDGIGSNGELGSGSSSNGGSSDGSGSSSGSGGAGAGSGSGSSSGGGITSSGGSGDGSNGSLSGDSSKYGNGGSGSGSSNGNDSEIDLSNRSETKASMDSLFGGLDKQDILSFLNGSQTCLKDEYDAQIARPFVIYQNGKRQIASNSITIGLTIMKNAPIGSNFQAISDSFINVGIEKRKDNKYYAYARGFHLNDSILGIKIQKNINADKGDAFSDKNTTVNKDEGIAPISEVESLGSYQGILANLNDNIEDTQYIFKVSLNKTSNKNTEKLEYTINANNKLFCRIIIDRKISKEKFMPMSYLTSSISHDITIDTKFKSNLHYAKFDIISPPVKNNAISHIYYDNKSETPEASKYTSISFTKKNDTTFFLYSGGCTESSYQRRSIISLLENVNNTEKTSSNKK